MREELVLSNLTINGRPIGLFDTAPDYNYCMTTYPN